ncbi:MAG: GNAT family N-acetyltransferase [Deltaproteobacteria bacterium]|nr:MAG: GNAT family N-acetyltransferase [Deltaproteobacteria bacterium]
MTDTISIRNAVPSDIEVIIAIDEVGPAEEKPAYWRGIFDHYVRGGKKDRVFLVAEAAGAVVGFIVGEVRAWEFGSPPCGWVFALGVSPEARGAGIAKRMFEEICRRLSQANVTTVRTMVDRSNKVTLSFFRSQGLRSGRYIELEKEIG